MQNDRPFRLIGVTGGIGSGKSTVCGCFAALGRLVLNADDIARRLTENDAAVRQAIRAGFGESVFRADGSLDRAGLARVAFASAEGIARLNMIIHPRVFEEIDTALAGESRERKMPFVVIEAALVYESGMDEWLDRVVVVDAPENVRIDRVITRDKTTNDEVRRRIAAQWPVQEKLRWADFVIVNDRNGVALDAKVRLIDNIIRALPPSDLPDSD